MATTVPPTKRERDGQLEAVERQQDGQPDAADLGGLGQVQTSEQTFAANVNASFGNMSSPPSVAISMNWKNVATTRIYPGLSDLHLPNPCSDPLPSVARTRSLPPLQLSPALVTSPTHSLVHTSGEGSSSQLSSCPAPSAPTWSGSDSGQNQTISQMHQADAEDWIVEASSSESCYGDDSSSESDSASDLQRHLREALATRRSRWGPTSASATSASEAEERPRHHQVVVPPDFVAIKIELDSDDPQAGVSQHQPDLQLAAGLQPLKTPGGQAPSGQPQAGTSSATSTAAATTAQPTTAVAGTASGTSGAGSSGAAGGGGGSPPRRPPTQDARPRGTPARGRQRRRQTRNRNRKSAKKRPYEESEESLSPVDDEAPFPSRISPRNKKPFQGYTKF